jgi:hypothetical protein
VSLHQISTDSERGRERGRVLALPHYRLTGRADWDNLPAWRENFLCNIREPFITCQRRQTMVLALFAVFSWAFLHRCGLPLRLLRARGVKSGIPGTGRVVQHPRGFHSAFSRTFHHSALTEFGIKPELLRELCALPVQFLLSLPFIIFWALCALSRPKCLICIPRIINHLQSIQFPIPKNRLKK